MDCSNLLVEVVKATCGQKEMPADKLCHFCLKYHLSFRVNILFCRNFMISGDDRW